jgi:3-oxoacyl-[acyl-carrier-protein] synthase-1
VIRPSLKAEPLAVLAMTSVSAIGRGSTAALEALRARRSGLRRCDLPGVDVETWIGRVEGLEEAPISGDLAAYDCRNNRLAALGLAEPEFREPARAAARRFGPARIGVFVGTSTSGIEETERAYGRRDRTTDQLPATFNYRCTHNVFSSADFVRNALGLEGIAVAISTACSSSAKVFAAAARAIAAGWCDAAVVGGVDTLCLTTLYGFRSLELLAPEPCRPWDRDRRGLSLGEAAGFALIAPPTGDERVALLGYGETSDAYHMTSPRPDGRGAATAIAEALARAGLSADDVDYVNLHGTGTPANDLAEDIAVVQVLGQDVPCSSTKGWTGHTLGAAGITEAVFSCLAVEHDLMPGCLNTTDLDPQLRAGAILVNRTQPVNVVVSNSFGFGGTNCSLVFGRLQ